MNLVVAGAAIAFILGTALLAAFFSTGDERFDRVAEWCYVLFGALGSAMVLAVRDLLDPAVPGTALLALTAVGLAGTVTLGVAELGTALRLVDFRRVAALVSLAFLLALAWIAGVSLAGLFVTSPLPIALAWLGVGAIAAGIVIVALIGRTPGVLTGQVPPDAGAMRLFLVPMVGITAWMLWLATLV